MPREMDISDLYSVHDRWVCLLPVMLHWHASGMIYLEHILVQVVDWVIRVTLSLVDSEKNYQFWGIMNCTQHCFPIHCANKYSDHS